MSMFYKMFGTRHKKYGRISHVIICFEESNVSVAFEEDVLDKKFKKDIAKYIK